MPLFAIPFPAVDPVIVEWGPLAIRWYSLAYIAGILLAWIYVKSLCLRLPTNLHPRAVSPRDFDDFFTWAVLGVVVGGRLGYVLFYHPSHYWENPGEIIAVWQGGMSFHGGFLGVALAMFAFTWRNKIHTWTLIDCVTAATPIGLFFGRLANFINAELWGRVTDVPWGVIFPGAGPLPRHPSQLYEAGLEGLVLFFFLSYLIFRHDALKRPGLITGLFTAGYGLARFTVEFARLPDEHLGFLFGNLTMGMLLSLPMVLVGIGFIFVQMRRWPAAANNKE